MDLKIFKKKKSFKKGDLFIDPNFYWRIILCFVFLCMLGVFFFGWYFFKKTSIENNISSTDTAGQVEVISKDRIKKVIDYFSNKEKKSVEIINSSPSIIDPSL